MMVQSKNFSLKSDYFRITNIEIVQHSKSKPKKFSFLCTFKYLMEDGEEKKNDCIWLPFVQHSLALQCMNLYFCVQIFCADRSCTWRECSDWSWSSTLSVSCSSSCRTSTRPCSAGGNSRVMTELLYSSAFLYRRAQIGAMSLVVIL